MGARPRPCGSWGRHVRVSDPRCRFCGATNDAVDVAPVAEVGRLLSRAAVVFFGMATIAACARGSGETTSSSNRTSGTSASSSRGTSSNMTSSSSSSSAEAPEPAPPPVASALAPPTVTQVAPLDNVQEFLRGTFRIPAKAPVEGPIPARLSTLPRDSAPLPKAVWLRFQSFGADRYKGWSVQMQIDDAGNIVQVEHLGDSTPDKVRRPAWPAKPLQKLDAATLADLRRAAAAFAAGPAYRGHEGLSYAPTFVVTVRVDGGEREIILEGLENDFVAHLRRITSFVHSTPAGDEASKAGRKPPERAKKP